MRLSRFIAVLVLPLMGCGTGSEAPVADTGSIAPAQDSPVQAPAPAAQWDLQVSRDEAALVFPANGPAAIRLLCPAGAGTLVVNVPTFRPVASEERLSVGSEGTVEALVADTAGDARRGGVTGEGALPDTLAEIVGGPVAVNYGFQNSGPHPAPPAALARAFVAACRGPAAANTPAPATSPCLLQDGRRLPVQPIRAIGTEPFWGARVEGRCVTYSHPEDQEGTRVWTQYTPSGDGGIWKGALGGRAFEMKTRAQPGCSDGMSDERYPIAVELLVNGERRTGCAKPIE